MADLEKTIKGLGHCGNGIKCETCPYHDENDSDEYSTSCNDLLCRDALELLKEKQPKKPIYDCPLIRCPKCKNSIDMKQKYCDECGQAIDWKDGDGE